MILSWRHIKCLECLELTRYFPRLACSGLPELGSAALSRHARHAADDRRIHPAGRLAPGICAYQHHALDVGADVRHRLLAGALRPLLLSRWQD